MIDIEGVSKTFTLHNQGAACIQVLNDVNLSVEPGECIALTGQSGAGKSTLMRLIYGNYKAQSGHIKIKDVDLVCAEAREVIRIRRDELGYVSQFLRVVPRVPALQVVAEPLRAVGFAEDKSLNRAAELLTTLNIPENLWNLSPTTFSGGEQQRVNIARGFAHQYPAMLLDEPTASLDTVNRDVVLNLILEAKKNGAAIVGIFHDAEARRQVCDREIDVGQFSAANVA
ncbi:MAG: phosphonate C-P lyase system protein PhnL [Granulosicoccus sp.]|nr:phosphonate C-P lyase system protein PhnL [Granulosicoccus sp.]